MFNIHEYQEKFKMYELRDENAHSWVKVAPERGGIISGFGIGNQDLLYLDEGTFQDTAASVRGGIPILFPICGQLENDQYQLNGKQYKMKPHGFARNFPWEVIGTDQNEKASITIKLTGNEQTKNLYPFDFELVFTYILKANELRIDQEYHNNSEVMMPIYSGFHPYFKVGDKSKIEYDIDGTIYFDYDDKKIKPFSKNYDMTNVSIAKLIIDQAKKELSFHDHTLKRKIILSYGKEFKYPLLWSTPGKDFLCVEPFMAKMNALNTHEDLQWIKPQGTLKTFFIIRGEML